MDNNSFEPNIKGSLKFFRSIENLDLFEKSLIKNSKGKTLSENLKIFDIFSSMLWGLRKEGWVPKREVAWLVTKLYACFPFRHKKNHTLLKQLKKAVGSKIWTNYSHRINEIIVLPMEKLEYPLYNILHQIKKNYSQGDDLFLDWVQLINDLSNWGDETIKINWTKELINK